MNFPVLKGNCMWIHAFRHDNNSNGTTQTTERL